MGQTSPPPPLSTITLCWELRFLTMVSLCIVYLTSFWYATFSRLMIFLGYLEHILWVCRGVGGKRPKNWMNYQFTATFELLENIICFILRCRFDWACLGWIRYGYVVALVGNLLRSSCQLLQLAKCMEKAIFLHWRWTSRGIGLKVSISWSNMVCCLGITDTC